MAGYAGGSVGELTGRLAEYGLQVGAAASGTDRAVLQQVRFAQAGAALPASVGDPLPDSVWKAGPPDRWVPLSEPFEAPAGRSGWSAPFSMVVDFAESGALTNRIVVSQVRLVPGADGVLYRWYTTPTDRRVRA